MNTISTETLARLRDALSVDAGDPSNCDDVALLAVGAIADLQRALTDAHDALAKERSHLDSREHYHTMATGRLQSRIDTLESEARERTTLDANELVELLALVTAERDAFQAEVHVLRVRLAR